MVDEYISRAKALADFEACNAENPRWTPQRVKTLLLRQPAADVVEVVRLLKAEILRRCTPLLALPYAMQNRIVREYMDYD